jgi:DNA polymerase III delta subunit
VIIKDLSDNRAAWAALPDLMASVPEEIHVVLIEPKPDKRTKTYKALQKQADIKEYKLWSEREALRAEQWTVGEAKRMGVKLDKGAAHLLVQRSLAVSEKGAVIDQWRLLSALEKLAPFGTIEPAQVEKYIEETPVESVFALFETALQGDAARVKGMIEAFQASEDPFKLFGLLSGQVFWLATLAVSRESTQTVARDFGTRPFVLGKLAPYVGKLSAPGIKRVVSIFAEADIAMKTSAAEPWLLIERALLKVAHLSHDKSSAR